MNKILILLMFIVSMSSASQCWASLTCEEGEREALINCTDDYLATIADLSDANQLRKLVVGRACSNEFTDFAVCSNMENSQEIQMILNRIKAVKASRAHSELTPTQGAAAAS